MRDRLIQKFTKAKKGTLGYTLTEMLVVVGIIVALLAIAIPSVISISKALRFRQRNDYAKAIFMAAQANLTEMRSDGGLAPLQSDNVNSMEIPDSLNYPFPAEEYSDEYVFTASDLDVGEGKRDTYALVLPVGSVDGTLREQHVIVEYNPITGNVFSVFYCEDDLVKGTDKTLLELYLDGALPRNTEDDVKARKNMMVGYYDGSGLSSSRLEMERTRAELDFDNGEEGIVTVMVPMPDLYVGDFEKFMEGLDITLTLEPDRELAEGETALPQIVIQIKESGEIGENCTLDTDGRTVLVTHVLDSLADYKSFANLSADAKAEADAAAAGVSQLSNTPKSLTEIMEESEFAILPGENITIEAEVTFNPPADRPAVEIEPALLEGVNPMFAYLEENLTQPGTYTLAVSNGRNLQNLNAIAPSVADKVSSVVFIDDIYWNQTVAYYNSEYGVTGSYANAASENPARALPYFVPIHNENLFGTARFVYFENGNAETTWGQKLLEILTGGVLNFSRSNRVPTLTDELDTQLDAKDPLLAEGAAPNRQIGETHAKINGDNHRVYYLNIDSTKYQVPNEDDEATAGTFYATGDLQVVDYYFTGLFGYVNTSVSNLHVVNPIVKGHNFDDHYATEIKNVQVGTSWGRPVYEDREFNATVYTDPATGALIGAGGYNTFVTNCSVYLDTKAGGFNWSYADHGATIAQADYSATAEQAWYGVSGEGAVGGLVGYAKSHRTTNGKIDANSTALAFSNCFAAVPVSGNLRGNDTDYDSELQDGQAGVDKDYGYSNGVGGFIGNSQLTNFYNCYASGNVRVTNTYAQVTNSTSDTLITFLGLGGNGRLSVGGGGFVGTSHGTRYTNCFSAGNVTNTDGSEATGGFVGMMCYDETKAYGHHSDSTKITDVAQRTIFENCYSVGMCVKSDGKFLENFSGANGKISTSYTSLKAYHSPDYYRLYAPYFVLNEIDPLYQTYYIFKDSYYLSRYAGVNGVTQESSSRCANPIGYSDLVGLQDKYRNAAWITNSDPDNPGQIEQLKNYPLSSDVISVLGDLGWEVVKSAYERLTGGGGLWGTLAQLTEDYKSIRNILESSRPTYDVYFKLHDFMRERGFRPETPTLENAYFARYSQGFPSLPWENARETNTHYYGEITEGMVYPFPKLNGLDYYGTWQEEPLTGGLAYYETYETSDGRTTGYYFDRAETSSLNSDEDTVIIHDGYAIFSATKDDTIHIYDIKGNLLAGPLKPEQINITLSSPTSPDRNSYYVTKIPDSVAEQLTPGGDGFYGAIQIAVTNAAGTEYFWALYNPNTAITNINNVTFANGQIDYPENPTEVRIRTARQFAALSSAKMEKVWANESITVIQQLNIDAMTYDWDSDGSITDNTDAVAVGSIGTEKTPFAAAYSGSLGYVEKAEIKGFLPKTAFFGNIGAQGKVEDLTITIEGGEDVDKAEAVIGSANADYAAVLAAVSSGTIDNVDITLTGRVDLTAKNAAGVLVGYAQGTEDARATITGCDITAENLGIDAGNAGGIAGQMTGCDMLTGQDADGMTDDNSLTISGMLGVVGDNAGGALGLAEDVNVDTLPIVLNNISAKADLLGGFAGSITDGTVKTVTISLAGTYSLTNAQGEDASTAVIAGAAAYAEGLTIQGLTVQPQEEQTFILSADTAAGMFGTAKDLTVQNSKAVINGQINGVSAAAGIASAIEGGTFAGVNAELTKGTIVADGDDGRAAGYAVTVKGAVQNATVSLNDTNSITGAKEAAGFACEISADVSGSRVAGNVNISSDESAAGFALKLSGSVEITGNGVTPALTNTAEAYMGNSNANLVVEGNTAAMFALEIGKDVNITNCYALGSVSGAGEEPVVSGFADSNAGNINGATANVTLSGGYAFVRSNTGTILNSYGWYGDGDRNSSATVAEIDCTQDDKTVGTVTSSYFVDLDVPVMDEADIPENEKDLHLSAMLYDSTGTGEKTSPMEITTDKLNGKNGSRWFASKTYEEYPYTKLTPDDYPYPMLRVHYGNWANPPQYAYGVVYYEQYKDGTLKTYVYDLSDHEVQGAFETGSLTTKTHNFNQEGVIVDAGYALFFKGENPMTVEGAAVSAETLMETGLQLNNSKAKYSLYALTPSAATVKVTEKVSEENNRNVTVGVYYAHEFGDVSEHIIRTEDQFKHVVETGSYKQTHDITLSANFATLATIGGNYDGGSFTLDASAVSCNLITTVSSKITNWNVKADALNHVLFGTIAQGAEVQLNGLEITSVGKNGSIATTVSGTLTLPDTLTIGGDTNSANGVIGTVNGTLNCGTITVNGNVGGKLLGTVGASATTTLNTISVTGTVSGKVFGTVGGTLNTLTFDYSGDLPGTFIENVTGTVKLAKVLDLGSVNTLVGAVGKDGTVTTQGIIATTVDGKLFGTVSGTVETGAITVSSGETALTGKLFESVSGTATTDAITVGAIGANGAVVGAANGSVTTTNITTGDIAANGMIFGGVSGKVDTGAISTGAVSGQIFGNVTASAEKKLSVDSITTNGNAVSGKIFNNVSNAEIGAITTGAVSGQVFGNVTGEVTTGAITLTKQVAKTQETSESTGTTETVYEDVLQTLSGQIFGTVSGTVNVNGKITTGDVAESGKLFNEVKANVTVGGITTGAANSSLIAKLSDNAVVTTGEINVASLGASLVGAFDGGTLQGHANDKRNIVINDCAGIANYLFSNTVSGTVQNYQTTLDTVSTGLVNELNGSLKNVDLTINAGDAEKVTANVITTFNGTKADATVNGLTVKVEGNMGGSLIETASKDVSGLTLTVGGNMSADVITSAASVTDLTVTVGDEESKAGSLSGNAIGTANGDVTALTLTVNGTMKGSAIGTATGNLSDVNVTADAVEVTTAGNFGVITGTLESGKTLSGSSVNVTTLNVTAGAAGSIGGLVGVNNGGTIGKTEDGKGCTVTIADFTVQGADGFHLDIGGVVGTNSGTIALNTQSSAEITYKQAATDTANIGGIVGLMNGGSLTGAGNTSKPDISGEINLTGTASANYTVGGAVGKDNITEINDTVEYKNVKATVAIGTNWAQTKNVTVDCPAGVGSVGMFVGYVHSGTFDTCSSEVGNNVYEFVGKVAMGTVTVSDALWSADGNYGKLESESESEVTSGSVTIKVDDKTSAVLTKLTSDTNSIGSVKANLTNCTFVLGSEVRKQTLGVDRYFYGLAQDGQSEFTIGTPAGITATGSQKWSHTVKAGDNALSKTFTGFYHKVSDTLYSKVYASSKKDEATVFMYTDYTYTYTLTYTDEAGTEKTLSTDEVTVRYGLISGQKSATVEFDGLYLIEVSGINNQKYLVVTNSTAVNASSTTNGESIPDDKTFCESDPLFIYVYTHANSTMTKGSESHAVALYDEVLSTIPTYTVGTLKLGDVTRFQLYPLTEEENAYFLLTFTPDSTAKYQRQKVTSEYVTAYVESTSLDDETDLPGETGEVPEGTESSESTESTESTEATEVATEPPASEDGTNE